MSDGIPSQPAPRGAHPAPPAHRAGAVNPVESPRSGALARCISGVHHAAIICSDMDASLRFYAGVLGLRVLADNTRPERGSRKVDLLLPDGAMLELFTFPASPPRVTNPEALGLRHLAFRVGDLDEALAALRDAGAAHEPVRIDPYTGARHAFTRDPDGLPLEFVEALPPEPTRAERRP